MNILIWDDDLRHIPHVCDLLRLYGHDVRQVTSLADFKSIYSQFKPDGLLIDLMMPLIGIPIDDPLGEYVAGIYIYNKVIRPLLPTTPFLIYTGTALNMDIVFESIKSLECYPEFKGVLEKGAADEDTIIHRLQG